MSSRRRLVCPHALAWLLVALPFLASGKKTKMEKRRIVPLTSEFTRPGEDDAINIDEMLAEIPMLVVNFMVDCASGSEAGLTADEIRKCDACRNFRPVLKNLSKSEMFMPLVFGEVDVDAEEALAESFNVTDVPSLMVIVNKEVKHRYDGPYRREEVSAWLQAAFPVRVVKSQKSLDKAIDGRAKDTVLVVLKGEPQMRTLLSQTAAGLPMEGVRAEYLFLQAKDAFSLQLYKGVNERAEFEFTPGTELFRKDFENFVKKEHVPRFGPITQDNTGAIMAAAANGLVWVCFAQDSLDALAKQHAWTFRKVAKKLDRYRFVYVDSRGGALPADGPRCRSLSSSLVSVALQVDGVTTSMVFAAKEITEETVRKFLKDAKAGKIPPTAKGEL